MPPDPKQIIQAFFVAGLPVNVRETTAGFAILISPSRAGVLVELLGGVEPRLAQLLHTALERGVVLEEDIGSDGRRAPAATMKRFRNALGIDLADAKRLLHHVRWRDLVGKSNREG